MFLIKYIVQTYCLLCCLFYTVHSSSVVLTEPRIISIEVNQKLCTENISCKYYLNVRGSEFLGHYSWRLTPNDGATDNSCNTIISNYEINEVETLQWISKLKITIPYIFDKIYFCLYVLRKENTPFGGRWVHQGQYLYLDPRNDQDHQIKNNENLNTKLQSKSDLQEFTTDWGDLSHDIDVNYLTNSNRLSREEAKDIEVLYNGKYRAIHNLDSRNYETNELRTKRNTDKYRNNSSYVENKDSDSFLNINTSVTGKNKDSDDFISPIYHKAPELSNNLNKPKLDEDALNKLSKKHGDVMNKYIKNGSKDYRKIENKYSDIEIENFKQTEIKINIEKHEQTLKTDFITRNDEFGSRNENAEANKDPKRKTRQISHPSIIEDRKTKIEPTLSEDAILNDDATQLRETLKVEAVRIEKSYHAFTVNDEGVPEVLEDNNLILRLIGEGLNENTIIAFTTDPLDYGKPCKFMMKGEYKAIPGSTGSHSALFKIQTPPHSDSKVYVCAKNLNVGTSPTNDEGKYIHQGSETWKSFIVYGAPIPTWFAIVCIIIFLMFSAIFSGLNLGLMSLDKTELKIISNTGTETERKHARTIMPVRDNGNFLLCSILLGNVAVNATLTIMLDSLTSGLFAVIFSTLLIVLLGEITPQAICSRHGLVVGAKTIMITKAVMVLTAPLAYPLSKALDGMLGEEIGNVYNRERLKELVKVTTGVNDLDRDEVNIISGALELRKKTVQAIMTKLEDAFMLPITSVLDFETMSEIIKSGFSRIPVYEGNRGNIVTVLFIKDLAFVDPDDNTPLRTLCQYYQNPCNFVFEDVTLDVMFRQFKDGHKGHMAFVHRINNEGDGDPYYETIGLVTLEDVIEEMIQCEIVDETDVFVDNRSKLRRKRPMNKVSDFSAFAERHENQRIHISPQMTLATFQFLNSTVDPFNPNQISETVLRRLLKQDVIQTIKVKGKDKRDPALYVYQQGKPVDYFVLILEGRVEVTVGRENLMFEAGPFTYFGQQALVQNVGITDSPSPSVQGSLQNINVDSLLRHTFVPDYSVRAVTDLVYLTVKRSLYLAAKRATLMEKGALSKGGMTEQIDNELDKRSSYVDQFVNSRPDGASTDDEDSSESTKTTRKISKDVDDEPPDKRKKSEYYFEKRLSAEQKRRIQEYTERESMHKDSEYDLHNKKKKATFREDSLLFSYRSPSHESARSQHLYDQPSSSKATPRETWTRDFIEAEIIEKLIKSNSELRNNSRDETQQKIVESLNKILLLLEARERKEDKR